MNKITIKGKEYPCYETCGAWRRFKQITGKEVSDGLTASDLMDYLWALTESACNASGVPSPGLSPQDFADNLSPQDFAAWASELVPGTADPEKKRDQA